jgi:uncharacterized membrane protein YphA (DoxX/SURF4 family)
MVQAVAIFSISGMMEKVNSFIKTKNIPSLMLRLGLGFVFMYAAVASLLQPLEWSGFLPSPLAKVLHPTLAVRLLAVFEIILALWLLSDRYRRYAAALATLMLAGVILANLSQLFVTFRDVGLLCAALALFFIED